MASGRVGGTSGKISGKVGSEVYQITKDASGKYVQTVQAYSPHAADNVTVKLALQQCATAVVERLMKDLKKVAKIAFQSARTKTCSVNMFSSYNLQRMLVDAKQDWYSQGRFPFPEKGNALAQGGTFIISSGTMKYDCYLQFFCSPFPLTNPYNFFTPLENGAWVIFKIPSMNCTIGEFMQENRLTYSSVVVVVCHMHDDENWSHDKYCFAIIKLNAQVRKTDIVSRETLDALFVDETNKYPDRRLIDPSQYEPEWQDRGVLSYWIGCAAPASSPDVYPYYGCAFSRDYVKGRMSVRSSNFQPLYDGAGLWNTQAYPSNTVGTWMNPQVPAPVPYPY